MDNFSQLSYELNKALDKTTKKSNGIFFTPKEYREKLLQSAWRVLKIENPKYVLEPSFGSGEFLSDIMELFPTSKVIGVELNSILYQKVNENLAHNNQHLFNEDFIKFNTDKEFDLILGNPPYVVVKDAIPSEFKEISSGRPNLYCWFIHKCIRLLSEHGVLAFVIPNSILNTSYYELLRKYILDKCDIVDIIPFDEKKTLFTDTEQATIGLVLQKRSIGVPASDRYVMKHNGRLLFSCHYQVLLEKLNRFPSLKDLGISVKTGTVVWNQHKEKLTENPQKGNLLIYSSNVKKGRFVPFINNVNKNDKKQYISIVKDLTVGPVILMNRGYGNTNYDPNMMYINDTIEGNLDGFLVENHLNIVYPTTEQSKNIMKEVYEYMISTDNIEYIKKFVGNGAMSKTEIETLMPVCLEHLKHN